MAANGLAASVEHLADEGFAVDGVADGTAHAHIIQGFAPVVQGQHALAAGCPDQHLVVLVHLQAADIVGGEIEQHIHLARLHSGHLGVRVIDEPEHGLVDPDLRRAAVPLVFGQGDAPALVPLLQPVRSGAHGVAGRLRSAVRVQDDGGAFPQTKQGVAIGAVQLQHHGQRIGCGHAGDVVEQRLARLVARIRRLCPRKAEQHGRGIEHGAIMKAHPGLQPEGVGPAIGRHAPRLGQQGRWGTAFLDPRQSFEHVVVHDLANRCGRCAGRVQAVGLQRDVDDQGALRRLGQHLPAGTCHRQPRHGGPCASQGSPREVHVLSIRIKH